MITVREVHKSFARQELFDGVSLQINARDRYALVGPNGSGKSTLFRMLLGEVEPDGGEIQVKRGVVAGYLPQENAPVSERAVLDEALDSFPCPDGRVVAKAKSVLMGLGFSVEEFERKLSSLSGGWAMRVAMARLLIQEPDLLLLDEPTNHLDLEALLWLQEYLRGYRGAIFVISHDRSFINAVCRAVVSVQDHGLKVYRGDYEAYVAEREAEKERLLAAHKRQQDEIAHMQDFIDRNRARASTASRAQSMIKRLEKIERIELPPDGKEVKIRFPQPSRAGVRVLQLKDVHKSYGEVKVYRGVDFELERGWKMAFVGHNGAGKSTLLKVLAGVLPVDAGERVLGMEVKTGYFSQHRDGQLDSEKTVLEEAAKAGKAHSEEFVRTVLGTFLFPGDAVFKRVSVLSGGEKSRLALVKLLLDPPNVLLMDEPTTHLDMPSVEALIGALKAFEGTICFITHDLYFINTLADHIVHVDQGNITVFPGNYEYFLRRQGQKAAEAVATPSPEPHKKKGVSKAEERRLRASERERARGAERLRKRIEKAQSRLDDLARDLADPAIYGDYAKVRAIGGEMEALQSEIQAKWKELEREG
ncbi:MAG: ATP-binding cassette domain-containing protein [Elusimicrobiota bacterium]